MVKDLYFKSYLNIITTPNTITSNSSISWSSIFPSFLKKMYFMTESSELDHKNIYILYMVDGSFKEVPLTFVYFQCYLFVVETE